MERPNGVTKISGDRLIAVVVPTYNEAGNMPELANRLSSLGFTNLRLVIVDDNSPDGTADVAKNLERKFTGSIDVVSRESKQGLGTAYVAGFKHALSQGAEYVVQMDADLSHSPEYIPGMIDKLTDFDVVVGSRYTKGGGVDETWTFKRRALSHWANFFIRVIAGLKPKDVTSGFKAYRASALGTLNLDGFQCKGFAFQAEVAHACQTNRLKVTEYPIVFVDRVHGKSKMSLFIMREALWKLFPLRWKRYNLSPRH